MNQTLPSRTGGQILIDALQIHGTDTVFVLPGESFLSAIDALYGARNAINVVVTRQEVGAATMAEAYGKLTGKPGICFVTRGPGASHAAIGVHTASQDSTPMILFVGQVSTKMLGREAWQEVDFQRMIGGMAKWVVEIDRPERIPELVSRAFHIAVSGRPGPVIVSLPEDMLAQVASVPDAEAFKRVAAHPGPDDLDQLATMIADAERPIVMVGGGGWNAQACHDLTRFIETFELPVVAGFRRQDIIDTRHPHYAGHAGLGASPALLQRLKQSDLIIAVGLRLGETTTGGYTLFDVPRPNQRFVHVHADAAELGRVYQSDLPINAGMPEFAAAAARMRPKGKRSSRDCVESARAAYLADIKPGTMPGTLDYGAVLSHIGAEVPNAIVTNGAGNYAIWVHRFFPYSGFRSQVAPTSGAMGYGLPAALTAKLVHPERPVICFAGDGCFLMTGHEMATATQYGLGIIIIVVNNGMYGSIRMHQENEFPGRVYATDLFNPDFPALARAYGGQGELVTHTEQFADAFARARTFADEQRRPALIELRIDPEAITPNATLSQLRERALAKH